MERVRSFYTAGSLISAILLPFYILAKHKRLTIFLLILTISLSPRVHLGTLAYGKLFDVRYEDLFLVIILFAWFMYYVLSKENRLYVSSLAKPILLYLLLAFISTAVGLYLGWIEPTRAFFFYLKEVEFFLIFLITINFVKDTKDLKAALAAFLLGGLINGFYIVYQYVLGNLGGTQDLGDLSSVYRYYGVKMVGESTPTATGNYFSFLFFLSTTLFITVPSRKIFLISLAGILLSIVGLVGSLVRTSIWATGIVLPLYFYFLSKQHNFKNRIKILAGLVFLLLILMPIGLGFWGQLQEELGPLAQRIVNIGNMAEQYNKERVQEVYPDYLKVIQKSPIIGLGKSITGQQEIPGVSLTRFYGEAHNNYLRILIEMGAIGLFVFLYLIFSVIRFSYNVFRSSPSSLARVVGLTCCIQTMFLLVGSLAVDAFVTARPIEIYWILVGLVMVVYRWNREKISA